LPFFPPHRGTGRRALRRVSLPGALDAAPSPSCATPRAGPTSPPRATAPRAFASACSEGGRVVPRRGPPQRLLRAPPHAELRRRSRAAPCSRAAHSCHQLLRCTAALDLSEGGRALAVARARALARGPAPTTMDAAEEVGSWRSGRLQGAEELHNLHGQELHGTMAVGPWLLLLPPRQHDGP
jgi:hypothetical protein